MQTSAPSTYHHLVPYISALGTAGPVTTIPLPHVVHSIHTGWMRKQAKPSPTLPLDICVEHIHVHQDGKSSILSVSQEVLQDVRM